MYDRDVDVPRLTAHFRLLTADGENAAVPAAIRAAAHEVRTRTGVPFTSVGLNRYRGEMHSWPGGPYAEIFRRPDLHPRGGRS